MCKPAATGNKRLPCLCDFGQAAWVVGVHPLSQGQPVGEKLTGDDID